jgi:hypothetical protein
MFTQQKIKEIDIDILPEDVKRELMDFYEYLINKYVTKVVTMEKKQIRFSAINLNTKGFKFNREEANAR